MDPEIINYVNDDGWPLMYIAVIGPAFQRAEIIEFLILNTTEPPKFYDNHTLLQFALKFSNSLETI